MVQKTCTTFLANQLGCPRFPYCSYHHRHINENVTFLPRTNDFFSSPSISSSYFSKSPRCLTLKIIMARKWRLTNLITLFFNAHANTLPLTQVLRVTTSQSSDDSTSWTYLAIFINFWLIIRFVIWFSFPKFNIFICLREKRKVEWIPSN